MLLALPHFPLSPCMHKSKKASMSLTLHVRYRHFYRKATALPAFGRFVSPMLVAYALALSHPTTAQCYSHVNPHFNAQRAGVARCARGRVPTRLPPPPQGALMNSAPHTSNGVLDTNFIGF